MLNKLELRWPQLLRRASTFTSCLINIVKSLFIGLTAAFLLFLFGTFLSRQARADFLQLDEVTISYKDFFKGSRDPLITQNGLPGRRMGQEINLDINTTMWDVFYWNNTVHSMTDKMLTGGGQFRLVGLQTRLGIRLSEYVDFGFYHFSRHLLDYQYPIGGYPVQDAIEFKIYLMKRPKREQSLLW